MIARHHILVGAFSTIALLSLSSCAARCPVPAPAPSVKPAPAKPAAVLEYVGGTAIQAKDPKALSEWYSQRFGLKIEGEMPGGFYGGFEWNETSFNIAIVTAGGAHPGSAPGTAYLVFHVGDYDGFVAALATKQLTPFKTTGEKGDDFGRFASFHDPEGNEVDVWGK